MKLNILEAFNFFFTMNNHVKIPLMVSCIISGHTLKPSRVRDLSTRHDQPSSAGRHTQPFSVSDLFSILVPAEEKKTPAVTESVLTFTPGCVNLCVCVCLFCGSYVMTGGGVPVASHSSSRGVLRITLTFVTSSAPSTKGGTKRAEFILLTSVLCVNI